MLGSPDDEPLGAHREQLELVHRNGLRLLKLVNALLDFARLQAGRMEASFDSQDLSQLTRDLASGFRSAIEHAGLRLDVTELRRLARQRDEFLAAAAHDLKSPLATIQGMAQLLERRVRQLENAPQSFNNGLAVIVQSTRRVAALVDELQDSMLMEAGALGLAPHHTDLV